MPMMPLMLFSQPLALEEMIEQALTLSQYETFSSIMRLKAKQVAMRRAWLDAAPTREVIASTRTFELQTALEDIQTNDTEEIIERLSQLWAGLGGRILGLVPGAAAADMKRQQETMRRALRPLVTCQRFSRLAFIPFRII